jgi:hypothetical protein
MFAVGTADWAAAVDRKGQAAVDYERVEQTVAAVGGKKIASMLCCFSVSCVGAGSRWARCWSGT